MDVTSHPLATADLQIRDPRKPLPPATTRRLRTSDAIVGSVVEVAFNAGSFSATELAMYDPNVFDNTSSLSQHQRSTELFGVLTSFPQLVS